MQNEPIKKTKSAHKLLVILAVATVLCGVSFFAVLSRKSSPTVTINNRTISVEIAKTKADQEKGLCCRDSLPADSGVLFVYEKPGVYRFWMKDTRIPLDMYWMDTQKKIIYIEENVQPESYPKSFGPKQPAQYILETNAGYAKKHTIRVGDVAQF